MSGILERICEETKKTAVQTERLRTLRDVLERTEFCENVRDVRDEVWKLVVEAS